MGVLHHRGLEDDQFAIMVKVHHAMIDGMGAMKPVRPVHQHLARGQGNEQYLDAAGDAVEDAPALGQATVAKPAVPPRQAPPPTCSRSVPGLRSWGANLRLKPATASPALARQRKRCSTTPPPRRNAATAAARFPGQGRQAVASARHHRHDDIVATAYRPGPA